MEHIYTIKLKNNYRDESGSRNFNPLFSIKLKEEDVEGFLEHHEHELRMSGRIKDAKLEAKKTQYFESIEDFNAELQKNIKAEQDRIIANCALNGAWLHFEMKKYE